MDTWERALIISRASKAADLHKKLSQMDDLSHHDKEITQLLAWFCLEDDTDPTYLLECEL